MSRLTLCLVALASLSGTAYGATLTCTTNDLPSNTVCGTQAYEFAQSAGFNGTAFGYAALEGNTGDNNTAVGADALQSNTTGVNDTAVGSLAIRDNLYGTDNTAIGFEAFYGLTFSINPASYNTAAGSGALENNGGSNNTAVGYSALQGAAWDSNKLTGGGTGSDNTGIGAGALFSFSTGSNNTASGYQSLYKNLVASDNTAVGYQSLYTNDSSGTGDATENTAIGFQALYTNSTGAGNTASGFQALYTNTGGYNTATGVQALFMNSIGGGNTATGVAALAGNSTGNFNTASGEDALFTNNADNNTALGDEALYSNSTGTNNTAVGYEAGYHVTTGSNNIHIGNKGATADSKVIKIGTEGTQKKTYIAGIYSNTAVSGLAVVIGSNGELGAVSSSERFKTDIATMGSTTEKLRQLRPVTFHYKDDQQGELRYGLIAEEVAKVYPELAVRDENGRIDGVRYDELAPMLLNEVQKEHEHALSQDSTIAVQAAKIASLEQQVARVTDLERQLAEMHAALATIQARDQLVAQR